MSTAAGNMLVPLAHALRAAWEHAYAALSWLGRVLETILQPILHFLLRILNPVCTAVADAVYSVLGLLPPFAGLALISIAAGIVMLVAFRYSSNQTGISRAKDDIKANLLALKLFKDDLRVAIRAQLRILWALLRLQRYVIVPVLWMALPTMLLLAQMAMRYEWRPFEPGERFVFSVSSLTPADLTQSVVLNNPDGVEVEAGPISDADDVAWRLCAKRPGRFLMHIEAGSFRVSKEIVVGQPVQRVSPRLPGRSWVEQLLYPIERPIGGIAAGTMTKVDVHYPEFSSHWYGSGYWLLWFFVLSMLSAFLLKGLFRVRF